MRIAMSISGTRSVMLLICLLAAAGSSNSQNFGTGYYRLTNKWTGDSRSLDVINDEAKNKLCLGDSGENSGQSWKLTPVGNGYYRLTSEWLGDGRSLDVVNDSSRDKLQLAAFRDTAGQLWKITPLGGGYYRLTTKWLGDGRSLDVVNDGQKRELQLADTDDVLGQYWKISPVSGSSGPIKTRVHPLNEFKRMTFAGFSVNLNPDLVGKETTNRAMDLVSADLEKFAKLLTPVQLGRLRKVPIWVQYKLDTEAGMWYHESKEWLAANDYPVEMEKSVEIADVDGFINSHDSEPFALLHELAHAYNDLYLSALREQLINAYKSAVKSGKYDKVERVGSGIQRAYAMTNEKEYFAELTEAYFGRNDYYPFTRDELEAFDPKGFELMKAAWDNDN